MENLNTYHIGENGFSMTDKTVAVPECKIKATGFLEAAAIMTEFMKTRVKPECMELITPMERIAFDH